MHPPIALACAPCGGLAAQVSGKRLYDTFDKTYTSQIPMIPKVTPSGNGYQIMNMTDRLRDLLLDFYEARKHDSMISHGVIAGGYTNNDKVEFHKIDLDRFQSVHKAIIREMQQVLQWWTKLRCPPLVCHLCACQRAVLIICSC